MNFSVDILWSVGILGIVVGALSQMILGMLWYSPALFGNHWMRALKIDPKSFDSSGQWVAIVYSAIVALLTTYGLGVLMKLVGVTTTGDAILLSLLVAFVFRVSAIHSIYEHYDKHPFILIYIHGFYDLIGFSLAGFLVFRLGF